MRAEPTTSPEISPKESCQRRFGSSKHQGRIDANANTAQRLRHWLASAAWRAAQVRPVLSSSALPASSSKKQRTSIALPVRFLTHWLVAALTAAWDGLIAPHCGTNGLPVRPSAGSPCPRGAPTEEIRQRYSITSSARASSVCGKGPRTLGTRIRSRRNAPVHAGGLCCDGKRLPTEATSMRLKSIEKWRIRRSRKRSSHLMPFWGRLSFQASPLQYPNGFTTRPLTFFDHENRKVPISKPAANAHRPNVQAETRRTSLRRSSCVGISWDRSVIIAAAPLRWPLVTGRMPSRRFPLDKCPKKGKKFPVRANPWNGNGPRDQTGAANLGEGLLPEEALGTQMSRKRC